MPVQDVVINRRRTARRVGTAALLGTALLLWACGDEQVQVPEHEAFDLVGQFELAEAERPTRYIDFGTPASRRFQATGWSDASRELPEEGRRGSWSMGDTAELTVFVARTTDKEVTLRCAAVAAHGTESMELTVNGQAWWTLDLDPGWREHRQVLPGNLLTDGWNRIGIRHLGKGERGIKKDTRVLWDDFRMVDVSMADADPASLAKQPKPIARPERGTLFVPFDTRLDYYLELTADSVLVAKQLQSRGSATGRLQVSWHGEGPDAEPVEVEDLSAAAEFALRLTDDRPRSGRLSLFAMMGEANQDQAKGILIHEPRIMAGRTTESDGPVAAAPSAVPAVDDSGAGAGKRTRPNILVYLVDTLRADHLGAYGYPLDVSPNFDALAAEGIVFENAQAQSPWTRSSVASMLTGLWPQSHRTIGDDDALSDEAVTLAEGLRDVGYATAAITGNGNAARVAGFAQGFDYFKYLRNLRPEDPLATSSDINEAVFAWLDEHEEDGRPFFLWVHTIDPHAPYSPPETFHERFAPGVNAAELGSIAHIQNLNKQATVDEAVIRDMLALYDAEIAANDASFGHLVDDLKRRGLYEDLVVVFLSDHGEEFYDHGGWTHGKTLNSEMLDTPLIFRLPGTQGGVRSTRLVQHVDIMPTLLEVASAEVPPSVQGRSFLSLVLAPQTAAWDDQAMAHLDLRGRQGVSFVNSDWKLIQYREGEVDGFPELYNRHEDRLEVHNLAPEQPEKARLLASQRRRQEARLEAGLSPTVVDAAERAKVEAELRALGYLQ